MHRISKRAASSVRTRPSLLSGLRPSITSHVNRAASVAVMSGSLNIGFSDHEHIASETTSYVSEVADIDRSAELFTWIFQGLFGKKQPETPTKQVQTRASGGAPPGPDAKLEVATLGGGCFWCLDACYRRMVGVTDCVSGYAGGRTVNPTYEQICNGNTGHAEVVQITYDANQVSFSDLLQVFFTIHDPTTLNRQGNDVGTQYRSCIMYHDENQKKIAEEYISQIQKDYKDPIVTEVVPLPKFYAAEDYHQDYYTYNPWQGYCTYVVGPKVRKFVSKFPEKVAK